METNLNFSKVKFQPRQYRIPKVEGGLHICIASVDPHTSLDLRDVCCKRQNKVSPFAHTYSTYMGLHNLEESFTTELQISATVFLI